MLCTLTPAQARCLFVGPWAQGFDLTDDRIVVLSQDDEGWILVGIDEDEGTGVWIDTDGVAHYSPPSREQTGDPWPVEIVERDGSDSITLRVARKTTRGDSHGV